MFGLSTGMAVFVHGGTPVRIVKAPLTASSFRALCEYSDGTRDWVSVNNIFATYAESVHQMAADQLQKVCSDIRELNYKLNDLNREHERLFALVHPEKPATPNPAPEGESK